MPLLYHIYAIILFYHGDNMDRTYGYGRDFHEGATYTSDYLPKKNPEKVEKNTPTKKEQLEQKLKKLL